MHRVSCELKSREVHGRINGRKVVAYWTFYPERVSDRCLGWVFGEMAVGDRRYIIGWGDVQFDGTVIPYVGREVKRGPSVLRDLARALGLLPKGGLDPETEKQILAKLREELVYLFPQVEVIARPTCSSTKGHVQSRSTEPHMYMPEGVLVAGRKVVRGEIAGREMVVRWTCYWKRKQPPREAFLGVGYLVGEFEAGGRSYFVGGPYAQSVGSADGITVIHHDWKVERGLHNLAVVLGFLPAHTCDEECDSLVEEQVFKALKDEIMCGLFPDILPGPYPPLDEEGEEEDPPEIFIRRAKPRPLLAEEGEEDKEGKEDEEES